MSLAPRLEHHNNVLAPSWAKVNGNDRKLIPSPSRHLDPALGGGPRGKGAERALSEQCCMTVDDLESLNRP